MSRNTDKHAFSSTVNRLKKNWWNIFLWWDWNEWNTPKYWITNFDQIGL